MKIFTYILKLEIEKNIEISDKQQGFRQKQSTFKQFERNQKNVLH